MRLQLLGLLVVLTTFTWATQAAEPPPPPVKPPVERPFTADSAKAAADKAEAWLGQSYDFKGVTFGDPKSPNAKMPGVIALVVRALAECRHDYRESNGPFITGPVKYLLECQQENGAFALKEGGRETYNTALTIAALSALENDAYTGKIEKARAYLLKCQIKDGGFSYGYGFHGGSDLSNTWIALNGLNASGYAKVKESADVYKSVLNFVRSCQDNIETNPTEDGKLGENSGGGYYTPTKSEAGTLKTRKGDTVPKPYGSMTAAALESFMLCGLKADAPEVKAALKWFKANFSAKENPNVGAAGYFYYAAAAARALKAAGVKELEAADGHKINWAAELGSQLAKIQRPDGSFVNTEAKWLEDDPVVCTAYALTALTLCRETLK